MIILSIIYLIIIDFTHYCLKTYESFIIERWDYGRMTCKDKWSTNKSNSIDIMKFDFSWINKTKMSVHDNLCWDNTLRLYIQLLLIFFPLSSEQTYMNHSLFEKWDYGRITCKDEWSMNKLNSIHIMKLDFSWKGKNKNEHAWRLVFLGQVNIDKLGATFLIIAIRHVHT